jgi:hypothetical protein
MKQQPITLRTMALIGAASLVGAATIALAGPANAMPYCQGGTTPWGGGNYCDGASYSDGSYDHCANVVVLGFGGMQCGRVCPPDPTSPALPLPWNGAPCTARG